MNSTIDALRSTFPAMGNTTSVVVVGGTNDHLDMARRRIDELESMWSRFIPSSDISRLNRAAGRTMEVAPETISLLQYMVDAHRATSGLFDPTRLPQLVDAGYTRSLVSDRLTILPTGVAWSHGLEEISIDAGSRRVTLPPDVTVDAGGIGKGFAADIVVDEILENGARGALVNVGGDLRCSGEGDRNDAWEIAITTADGTGEIERVRLQSGAIATSSVHAKTFMRNEELRSHIIDPRTDHALEPHTSPVIQASVIADECVWAEVMTKALILEQPDNGIALIDGLDLAALIVTGDGSFYRSPNWATFRA